MTVSADRAPASAVRRPPLLARVNRVVPLLRGAQAVRLGWRRLRRPIVLGVRAVVTDSGGRVLLIRHSYDRGWHLPGGGVGRGESLAAAARRELREEVGLEASGPLRLLGMFLRRDDGAHDHIATFLVERWTGEPAVDGFEIAECRFFDPGALPLDTSAGTRRRLDELCGVAPVSEAW